MGFGLWGPSHTPTALLQPSLIILFQRLLRGPLVFRLFGAQTMSIEPTAVNSQGEICYYL